MHPSFIGATDLQSIVLCEPVNLKLGAIAEYDVWKIVEISLQLFPLAVPRDASCVLVIREEKTSNGVFIPDRSNRLRLQSTL